QMRFNPPVDNNSATPFVPVLFDKPHALAPLQDMFKPSHAGRNETAISAAMQSHLTARLGLSNTSSVPHPYERELEALEFSPEQMGHVEERTYGQLEDTKRTWIGTLEGLKILIGKLSLEKEIAVDLEQHFFRSYPGFVCLM